MVQEVRTRDPERRSRIIEAVADLIVDHGYQGVSMADVGQRVGISAAAIYRHFPSKGALLVAVFDRAIDQLLEEERRTRQRLADPGDALAALVARQIDFVVDDREFARIYHGEADQLPEEDRLRLRRKQRAYLHEWETVLLELRPALTPAEARTVVHSAIGAIQAPLFHRLETSPDRLKRLLTEMAHAVLGVPLEVPPAKHAPQDGQIS
ncbi:MAG: TetR family transcriptional regulator [Nocardioides sp.]|jgi:AcrR family transcriptional regulator|nr:TetR family transcriptional regulator [Nocardioides sp.]